MTPKRNPSAPATDWERLKRRLIEELHLDIAPDAQFHRTYPGYWQRSQGAWSWFVWDRHCHDYGSQTSIRNLSIADKLTLTNFNEIDDS